MKNFRRNRNTKPVPQSINIYDRTWYEPMDDYIHLTLCNLNANRNWDVFDMNYIINDLNHFAKTQNKKISLGDEPESFEPTFLKTANDIFHRLILDYGYSKDDFQIVVGAAPVQENIVAYSEICEANKFIKVPIKLINFFEYYWKNKCRDYSHLISNISYENEKPFIFNFLNNIGRPHRIYLYMKLQEASVLHKSLYSFMVDKDKINSALYNPPYRDLFNRVRDILFVLDEMPLPQYLTLPKDKNELNINLHQEISPADIEVMNRTYFSLITETSFFESMYTESEIMQHLKGIFHTEKTFRSIACKHPFIIAGRPRSLHALREFGYQTFHPLIDESYDYIEDDWMRLDAIVKEVKRLYHEDKSFWREFVTKTKSIVEHNFEVLKNCPKRSLYCDFK